jgi:crotonobetainyl-CoA:carnitine CoA-transferase CaiB-like acyl-CoA transferase
MLKAFKLDKKMSSSTQNPYSNSNTGHSNPFDSIKVIDFTHVLAGPACSYYLALMGADVIKLESVRRGDGIRHRGGTAKDLAEGEMSTSYLTQGAGKRSIAVDLGTQEGRNIALRLIAECDVLVENHRPSTLKPLGLDYDTLSQNHPRLIYCALTGYGQNGPKGNHAAYDVNIQAASGIMAMTGTPETGPLRTGAPIMDYATGLAGAFAVSSALFAREQSKRGTFIDVSMLEVAFTMMSSTIADYTATGNAPIARGNAANSRSPAAGNFQTADGLISLGVNEEHQFAVLCHVLEKPEWLEDPRFSSRQERDANRQALLSELETIFVTRPASEWEVVLGDVGVPVARVSTLPETLESSQVIVRQPLHGFEIDRFPHRTIQVPTLPFLFNGHRQAPNLPPPRRGEHSVAILKEIGCTKAEIDRLISQGIVEQLD